MFLSHYFLCEWSIQLCKKPTQESSFSSSLFLKSSFSSKIFGAVIKASKLHKATFTFCSLLKLNITFYMLHFYLEWAFPFTEGLSVEVGRGGGVCGAEKWKLMEALEFWVFQMVWWPAHCFFTYLCFPCLEYPSWHIAEKLSPLHGWLQHDLSISWATLDSYSPGITWQPSVILNFPLKSLCG